MNVLPVKAGPIRNGGNTSVITELRKKKVVAKEKQGKNMGEEQL